jgi:hypothetical protein
MAGRILGAPVEAARSRRKMNAPLQAGVVKLADARDSKSRGVHSPCGFDSHLRHQTSLAFGEPTLGGTNPVRTEFT